MATNPYYRIYRPFTDSAWEQNGGQLFYVEDERNCAKRIQLIRMYKTLQMQVIDTFQYVEPVPDNKDVYSLRYHQLYGNICAEIETNFRGILRANNYTRGTENDWNMKDDYFKASPILKLSGYKLESHYYELLNHADVNHPFASWSTANYAPLTWYKEHNQVKHDRSEEFKAASLKNVLAALTGLYVLLYAQFGFLVDTITNHGILQTLLDNNEHFTFGTNNELGYNFIQTPTWSNSEEYDFKWETIKAYDTPYIAAFLSLR